MDRFDDDTLAAELRLMRPTPRPGFTAELDERAAAGFPRRSPRPGAGRFAPLAAHWHDLAPRRSLFAVAGLALAVLAVATVVVLSSGGGNSSHEVAISETGGSSSGTRFSGEMEGTGEAATSAGGGATSSHKASKHSGAAQSGETVYAPAEVPMLSDKASGKKAKSSAEPVEAAEEAEEGTDLVEENPEETGETYTKAQQNLPGVVVVGGSPQRDIERSAYVVLGTKPGEVGAAAAKVYAAVHEAEGVVLHSSVHSGKAGATGATFTLLIPSGKLDDALAVFSQIAEVRERHDATNDITEPTVNATEELRDSNASIEGLLKELGDVETEAERESVEARLREERRQHAAIRAKLDNLDTRASMSEVSVRIVTGKHAGVTPVGKGSGGGTWGVGDALHDAGKVLTVAAGVLLIALAVLAPIALILLLGWSINRFRVRRLRERALG